jgi:hypothetical protein
MVNIIHKKRVANYFASEIFPNNLNVYLDLLIKNKFSDFFIKTKMLLRFKNAKKITLYRCSRWVILKNEVVPEWNYNLEFYQKIASTLILPLDIRMSVFDLKTKENESLMFLNQEKFSYEIVSDYYAGQVVYWQVILYSLYRDDVVFAKKIENIRVLESAKFKQLEFLMLYFAELCTAISIAKIESSAIFVHDTRRISIINYLEKISIIPKVPFLPLPRRNGFIL